MTEARRAARMVAALCLLLLGAGGCTRCSGDVTPRAAATADAGRGLVAGVARTPEEVAACHAEEAERAAESPRRTIPPPAQPLHLREDPADLTLKDCDALVLRWNFYSAKNKGGCFVNAFRATPGGPVTDLATGLTWQDTTSPEPLAIEQVGPYLETLNRERFGGFSNWRLPTLEEAFSLVESAEFDNTTFVDKLLFVTRKEWWTSDVHTAEKALWVMYAGGAACLPVLHDQESRYHVRAVRSAE